MAILNFFRHTLFALSLVVSGGSLSAAINWNLTYQDVVSNTGFGFDDPAEGATRRSTFEAALNYVSSVLNETGSANLTVERSENEPASGRLASAGTTFFTGGGFREGFVIQSIQGTIPGFAENSQHGRLMFNFGRNYNSGLGSPAPNQFDLFTVSLHEIAHTLGFISLLDGDGTSAIESTDTFTGSYSSFDQFLRLANGDPLFSASGEFIATTDSNNDGIVDALVGDSVVFDGTNALAANGGDPVPIFSPSTFLDGSSLSHIDVAGNVLEFAISPGEINRTYSELEVAILRDIGYSNAAVVVPEPSSLAISLISACAIVIRRRRRL